MIPRRRRRTAWPTPVQSADVDLPPRVESQAGWEALDGLPEPLRTAIKTANRPISPVGVAEAFYRLIGLGLSQDAAAARIIERLRDIERAELRDFTKQYGQAHGVNYPHCAASASLLRYRPG